MSENQTIEYKKIWRDEYLKWVCGFANANGGELFIGMDDDGDIIGVPDAAKLMEDIPNKIRDVLGIIVNTNLLKMHDRQYIQIIVEPYPYPINYKGQYHYRTGSTKQELKGVALNKFLLERIGKRWDSIPLPKITVDDLSPTALQRFRNEAAQSHRVDAAVLHDSAEHLLQDLQLTDTDTGNLKRAAVLLFHPNPEKFVTGAYVKIGFFRGTDDDLAFQDEVHGPIMEQIDKAIDLLTTKYTIYAISYEGVSRRETPSFPKEALRESLLNSIAHKDYSTGIPIQISVYPDHIVFWNPGQLPEQLPIEKLLKKHPSIPYNPDIANALFRSGDIEAWGRGYRKIIKSVLEQKQLPPRIEYLSGIMLTYFTDVRTQLTTEGMDEKSIAIIKYVIENGSINNSEVQKLLNVSKPTATRLLKQTESYLEKQGTRGMGTIYVLRGRLS